MRTAIAQIDKQIKEIHRELRRRERITRGSAESWQRAWDLHPELQAQERELYRQRGHAQRERDLAAHKAWMAEKRTKRFQMKKCPTCKQRTLKAA